MKITFKGIVDSMKSIETTKTPGFQQTFIVKRPERKNEFNQVTQKESFFEVSYWTKDLERMYMQESWIGKKVEIEGWLNSSEWINPAGEHKFILNINLKNMKEF